MNRETRVSGTEKQRMNGEVSPEALQRDLDHTRADLNDTLRALGARMSPGQMLDEAMGYIGGGPKEYARNLGAEVKRNPMPVALVGIGLTWLMMGRGGGAGEEVEYTSEGIEQTGRETYGKTKESLQGVRERAGEKKEELRARMSQRMDETREGMTQARETAKERGRKMAGGVRYGGERAREGFSYLLNEQPLALGAIGIAVGALLGAGVPATQREREAIGPKRDELMEKARRVGGEEMEKTRKKVAETAHEVRTESP